MLGQHCLNHTLNHHCLNVSCLLGDQLPGAVIRDAPLDIWGGGGGLEFLLLATFFFYLREKTIFFLAINVRQFFLCFVEEFFCRMLSLLCRLPFGVFSGQHNFHKFRQQTFFSAHIFNKLSFFDFRGDKLFFSFFFYATPPPPQISNGASLTSIVSHGDLCDKYK